MHKRDQESILIKTLVEGQTIAAACKRAGISRQTHYRLYRSNVTYRKRIDAALREGREYMNDVVVASFHKQIHEGKWQPTHYYLKHNVKPYMKKDAASPPPEMPLRRLRRAAEFSEPEAYEQFIRWSAMSPEERAWYGIETIEQFCDAYHVPNSAMLGIWSQKADFESRVTALREEWIFSKTIDVLGKIYDAARGGDHRSQRLWLEHMQNIAKKRKENSSNVMNVSPADVRALIDGLPEPMRSRNHARLSRIIDDASEAKHTGMLREYQDGGIANERGEILPNQDSDPDPDLLDRGI